MYCLVFWRFYESRASNRPIIVSELIAFIILTIPLREVTVLDVVIRQYLQVLNAGTHNPVKLTWSWKCFNYSANVYSCLGSVLRYFSRRKIQKFCKKLSQLYYYGIRRNFTSMQDASLWKFISPIKKMHWGSTLILLH